ncbi:MAG: nicotinate-nucleotide adenylyltransferase [Actinomycetota bacterium]|nr:nicotinate-nucleotide adenylyltransferase [Actinomycetota bacterium]
MANSSPRAVGVMGGTFNPIHYGHLVTAEEALVAFDLEQVVFVPAGHPWQKDQDEVAPAEDRYLMTVIATATNDKFHVSRIEIDRPGPTYTIDTLRGLKETLGGDAELWFISGADGILNIITWKDPEAVLREARFIAATRPGYDLDRLEKELPSGFEDRVSILEIPALAISSTDIRRRVRERRPLRYLVPEGVARYIEKRGLYGGGAPST